MEATVIRETPIKPPVKAVLIEMTWREAVELRESITSVFPNRIKDRVWDELTRAFRNEGLPFP
mgnify:CR=1 FL=1